MKSSRRRIWTIYVAACAVIVAGLLWARWYFREPGNFSEIDDGLYMGGYLKEPPSGVDAVLNLALSKDPYRCNIHRWEPIRDSTPAPSLVWLQRMVDWIDCKRRHGHTTYIHCRQGVSRSGTVVVAFIMYRKKWPRDRALAYVRTKREIVRPNPAFMELLKKLEATVLPK